MVVISVIFSLLAAKITAKWIKKIIKNAHHKNCRPKQQTNKQKV